MSFHLNEVKVRRETLGLREPDIQLLGAVVCAKFVEL